MNAPAPRSRRAVLKLGMAGALIGPATLATAQTDVVTGINPAKLKDRQRTPLGLYLSPTDAHSALRANPDILFVDVRDPIEISFVGHPEGLDKIIPLGVVTHQIDPGSGQYRMVNNPNVVAEFDDLRALHGKSRDATIFVTCRSGARSAVAVRMLAQAGYTNVWNLVEGFEGDKDATGARTVNGWRNAGLPWGYTLGPGVAWTLPA